MTQIDELKSYKKLLDEGVITQEEFDTKKKELLVDSSTLKDSASVQIDEIKNYKNLLDEGVITQEEFDKKKHELLSKRYAPSSNQSMNAQNFTANAEGFIQSVKTVPTQTGNIGTKSKIAAGLLGIFLGIFGVHNFYLGYTSKAVLQLVLSIIGIILSIIIIGAFMFVAVEIWGFIEGIMILASSTGSRWHLDASGNELRD